MVTAATVFVVAGTVLVAAATQSYYVFQKEIALPWNLVVTMAVAVMVRGQIAPRLSGWFSERFLKRALFVMFPFIRLTMVVRVVGL